MENFYEFNFEGQSFLFPKDNDKDKYVVFICAKRENEYLEEYVEHYLKIGFDKIIIADNNDQPNELNSILQKHIEAKKVQILPINGLKGKFQTNLYDMFAKEGNFKWCAFFDADEFLEISHRYKDVKDFLSSINEDAVLVQWLIYGPNKQIHKAKGGVQERFKEPFYPINTLKENMYFKSIIRGGTKCSVWSPHSFIFEKGRKVSLGGYIISDSIEDNCCYPLRYKKCFLKHYITKSFEEYKKKSEKGRISFDSEEALKSLESFFVLDDSTKLPVIQFSEAIFWGKVLDFIDRPAQEYDMIAFMNITSPFNIILYGSYIMSHYTNKTVVVNENIDENLYNTLLEISLQTGNNLIAAPNDNNVLWDIFSKNNSTNKETYYIF